MACRSDDGDDHTLAEKSTGTMGSRIDRIEFDRIDGLLARCRRAQGKRFGADRAVGTRRTAAFVAEFFECGKVRKRHVIER